MAMVSNVGNAATVMEAPLPFSIYPDHSWCRGNPLTTGVITSVKALRKKGNFCENTLQLTDNGDEIPVYTKVKITSCEAVPLGYAFLDAYTCSDSECQDCTDTDNLPIQANLMLPKFTPLPESDTCWGVEAISTGMTVFNQFDPLADPDSINTYWTVFMENSCLKETVEISSASTTFASLAATASMGVLLAASLLN
eukprot:CAMPEP_0116125790 /NCGR_PEP_ID=MMETSP0329-20121206/5994_1 /TAXON_ID=697910 /ORGANISM="Pseudo-nitzschia arenysensis, Strain B593" /LENGTH=195 /DNA_ID=CAMNT_0003619845 /DNA_START=29 /DNA_END=616 /DNA_ORIENTATION=-